MRLNMNCLSSHLIIITFTAVHCIGPGLARQLPGPSLPHDRGILGLEVGGVGQHGDMERMTTLCG